MQKHLRDQVHRKVSHFILGEEGKVGCRSAFSAAAFIGATSLAGMLLSTPKADADWLCGGEFECHDDDQCCGCWDADANAPHEGCIQGTYDCRLEEIEFPGISCWTKP